MNWKAEIYFTFFQLCIGKHYFWLLASQLPEEPNAAEVSKHVRGIHWILGKKTLSQQKTHNVSLELQLLKLITFVNILPQWHFIQKEYQEQYLCYDTNISYITWFNIYFAIVWKYKLYKWPFIFFLSIYPSPLAYFCASKASSFFLLAFSMASSSGSTVTGSPSKVLAFRNIGLWNGTWKAFNML